MEVAHAVAGFGIASRTFMHTTRLVRIAPRAALDAPCVASPDDRRIEVVADPAGGFEALGPSLLDLHVDGWDVVVVVPLASIGSAHVALRGSPCSLQPWWSEDGRIEFGAFEIP